MDFCPKCPLCQQDDKVDKVSKIVLEVFQPGIAEDKDLIPSRKRSSIMVECQNKLKYKNI